MHRLTRRDFLAVGGASVASVCAAPLSCFAAPRWVDYRTYGPFRCQSTFPLESFAPLFGELSALDMELQRTLALPPAGQTIDVYLFDKQSQHRQMLAELYPRVPYRRALYVQRAGQGSVFAYRHRELAVDLRHECTHALLHTNLPMVPLWLDEGLAEYFEMPAQLRAWDHPHFSKLRWNLRFGMVRSIQSLEQCDTLGDMGSVEYRFSWAWVHYMLHGPLPAHRALVHYFRDIQRGTPPGQLSERLRAAVPDLDHQLARHFRHWRR